MIFRKALLREFAGAALGAFFVLLGITITTQLVRLLGQAASGAITTTGVVALLGLTLVSYLPVLLSLTLFIAVLMTLTRSYRDSEMVVWFSCGVSLIRWVRPVLVFAVPLVFTIALLSLVLSPWAVGKAEEFRRLMDTRDDASAILPGVFRESRQAERVYFVEEVSGTENLVANVFVSSTQHRKTGVMVASRGFQETTPNGDRFLVLLNGRRYEGEPGTAEYEIFEFERYAMRVESSDAAERAPTTKTTPTLELLRTRTPRTLAELSWRIGLPLSALILSLLAIPLSFVNPRAGRPLNLVLALLVYMVYSNLLSIVQASIAQSRVDLTTGLWGVHVVMFAVLLLLFHRRLMVFSLFRFIR
ncbi:MAG: LPS export ABC transporter permease LptF [Betaproteobacteria bacterium RIFCSPLOWO2_12_FULL_62_13]|nr:MAG: LPS export ABC transporter permease LptF [Betaproteobacteria bacterium RIFCSPLOWO2_12_FULL_62_13]